MSRKASIVVFSAVSSVIAGLTSAAPFTPGDLAVYRVGTGTATLTSASTAVFVDEYTPTGTLVQSIPMPTTASGTQGSLTSSGTATSEGMLTASADMNYIALTGYNAPTGTASIANSVSATTARVVGVLNTVTGTVDTSTELTNFSSGNNPRSAVTEDGTNIYVSGAAGGAAYTTLGSTTATTLGNTAAANVSNGRQINIFGNQLYLSTASGSTFRIAAVGTGTPTTTGQTEVQLSGLPVGTAAGNSTVGSPDASPYSFVLTTLDNSASPDVLYIADNGYNGGTGSTSGSIEKWVLSSGTWSLDGLVQLTGVTGLTAVPSATSGQENLYATNGSSIDEITDTGGSLTGDPVNDIVNAPSNEAFRGIAAVPEPASAGLLFASAASLLLRRRRQI
jgi:hypothetical protein